MQGKLLETQLSDSFSYHTIDHTATSCEGWLKTIGTELNLDDSDEKIGLLDIAAWLHDLGYIRRYIGHEDESIAIARDFLV